MIGASTRVFTVLGDPVGHSLSPRIQNAALEAEGLDGIYVAMRCGVSELSGLVRGIALAGGGGNVTVPHKAAAARAVDEPTDLVRRTGACNTFWSRGGKVHGDNTDVAGFRGAARSLLGAAPSGARVLLLGAGGAARAALLALVADGAEGVTVLNRTVRRAEELAAGLGEGRAHVASSRDDLAGQAFDLVVNATSLGLSPDDPRPVDLDLMQPPGAVLDLVYRPEETRLVAEARARGIRAADGGEMLVRQGAEAFERWWSRPAPVEAMMGALKSARRESVAPGASA